MSSGRSVPSPLFRHWPAFCRGGGKRTAYEEMDDPRSAAAGGGRLHEAHGPRTRQDGCSRRKNRGGYPPEAVGLDAPVHRTGRLYRGQQPQDPGGACQGHLPGCRLLHPPDHRGGGFPQRRPLQQRPQGLLRAGGGIPPAGRRHLRGKGHRLFLHRGNARLPAGPDADGRLDALPHRHGQGRLHHRRLRRDLLHPGGRVPDGGISPLDRRMGNQGRERHLPRPHRAVRSQLRLLPARLGDR